MSVKMTDWFHGRTRGVIKRNTLKSDLLRGVTFLNEVAYSNHWGSTKSSILFFNHVRKLVDISKVYRADFNFENGRKWYTVRLFTKDNYIIQFKGISFGYWGEGSRGSMAILQECGFTERQINKLFVFDDANKKSIRLFRRLA